MQRGIFYVPNTTDTGANLIVRYDIGDQAESDAIHKKSEIPTLSPYQEIQAQPSLSEKEMILPVKAQNLSHAHYTIYETGRNPQFPPSEYG